MVLLPKADGDADVMNRRPINLLSMIFRVWARVRGRLVQEWRASWDPAVAVARLGADGQAWELAWAAGVAMAGGAGFGGAAVDFRKAYDGVRLGLMDRVLTAAGISPRVLRPLMGMYRGGRRIRVAGALGGEWTPESWVPAGCPLAVDVMAVLTWPWAGAMAELEVNCRRYVDDLTF